jgi:hypothetical protein
MEGRIRLSMDGPSQSNNSEDTSGRMKRRARLWLTAPRRPREYQQHELAKRFNALMNALADFASSYNAGVVNPKKAKAVRKALRELEKSDWFRPVKGD